MRLNIRNFFLAFFALSILHVMGQSQPFSPATIRQDFLKMIDRPRVALAPELKRQSETDGLEQWHLSYASEAQQRVPGLIVKQTSANQRSPVVIVLHGTGGNKEGQIPLLKDLAKLGFIAVAIDGRYHGERTKSGTGSAEYGDAMLRTYRTGKELPFLYDTCWDVMRLLDYLETRSDVDAKKIALIGFSKGGMETYLTAAVDPRVAAAIPFIGVQSFRWALENNSWQSRVGTFQAAIEAAAKDEGVTEINAKFVQKFYDRVMPGIYNKFDGNQMTPLIAPRPLFVINGDSDARTPMPGLMICIDAINKAYGKNKDKFTFKAQPKTGHAVTDESRQEAIAWLQKWLTKIH